MLCLPTRRISAMKFKIITILFAISLSLSANKPLKIGVIADPHFLSEKLMDDNYAVDSYIASSGKNIKVVPKVLDQVLKSYEQNVPDILLINGDMTKDGERQSHLDLVAKLKPLQDKGTRVFVVPGNHDINMPNSVQYVGNKTISTANVSPDEFIEIYKNCGYGDALKRDTASLSYVAKLDESTWLLTIDVARYKEYKDRSLSSGKLSPQTEQWVVDVLTEAHENNIEVIGMMHWGLVEHIMFQSMFFKDYLVQDWQRLASLFADLGMKAIFTGHFHSNDITAYTSAAGNTIYDIETGTLSAYPFAYRTIEYSKGSMDIKTQNVKSVPGYPNLADDNKKEMLLLAKKMADQKLKSSGYNLSDSVRTKMADAIAQLFVLHLAGDEQLTPDLEQAILEMAKTMDAPVDLDDLELDFAPADNNVILDF